MRAIIAPTTYDLRSTIYDLRPTTYDLRSTTYDLRPTTYDPRPDSPGRHHRGLAVARSAWIRDAHPELRLRGDRGSRQRCGVAARDRERRGAAVADVPLVTERRGAVRRHGESRRLSRSHSRAGRLMAG